MTTTSLLALFAAAFAFSSVACSAEAVQTKSGSSESAPAASAEEAAPVEEEEAAPVEESAPAAPAPKPAAKKGCDGVAGSGKVLDFCGVCGGDESSCSPCAAEDIRTDVDIAPGGAFISVTMKKSKSGTTVSFADGKWHGNRPNSSFPCRTIEWTAVAYTCNAGKWEVDPATKLRGDWTCSAFPNDPFPANLTAGVF